MMDQSMLEIKNLHVYFHGYEGLSRVLDGISLNVGRSEQVGLAGETGCGKTVTVKSVMGLLKTPPAVIPQGEVILAGENILEMSDKQLMKMKGTQISMISSRLVSKNSDKENAMSGSLPKGSAYNPNERTKRLLPLTDKTAPVFRLRRQRAPLGPLHGQKVRGGF